MVFWFSFLTHFRQQAGFADFGGLGVTVKPASESRQRNTELIGGFLMPHRTNPLLQNVSKFHAWRNVLHHRYEVNYNYLLFFGVFIAKLIAVRAGAIRQKRDGLTSSLTVNAGVRASQPIPDSQP
jgi:hypothetical protein